MENLSRLTKGLRGVGAVALITSATVFLIQGMDVLTVVSRLGLFLLLDIMLAGLGWWAGNALQESKGARSFLALAAAGVPVLMAQAGALIYSALNLPASRHLPQVFVVESIPLTSAVICSLGTFLVVAPLVYVSLSALWRENRNVLSLVVLVTSAWLLFPARDASVTSLVLFSSTAILFVASRRLIPRGVRVENAIAGVVAVLPTVILIGRSLFYSGSDWRASSIWLFVTCVWTSFLPALNHNRRSGPMIWGSLVSGAFFWSSWIQGIGKVWPILVPFREFLTAQPILFGLLWASTRFQELKGTPRSLVTALSCLVSVTSLLAHTTAGMSAGLLLVGVAMALLGYYDRERNSFLGGVVNFSLALLYLLAESLNHFVEYRWVGLATLGVLALVVATLLESERSALRRWMARLPSRFPRAHNETQTDPSLGTTEENR